MKFFNKSGNEISQNIQTSKWSKGNSDEAKLEEKIKQERAAINEAISQIGKIYYETYRNDSHDKLIPICNMIDESNRVITVCEKQILLLKGIQICPNCKANLDLESIYCNKCGTKLDAVEEIKITDNKEEIAPVKATSEGIIRCHECGSAMPSDIVFCTNCGVKMKTV